LQTNSKQTKYRRTIFSKSVKFQIIVSNEISKNIFFHQVSAL
jgi:hypothetical protein